MSDKPNSIYMPVRLSRQAVEKLDLIAGQWLCATRAEAIRRLIADHNISLVANGDQQTEVAPQPDSEAA